MIRSYVSRSPLGIPLAKFGLLSMYSGVFLIISFSAFRLSVHRSVMYFVRWMPFSAFSSRARAARFSSFLVTISPAFCLLFFHPSLEAFFASVFGETWYFSASSA